MTQSKQTACTNSKRTNGRLTSQYHTGPLTAGHHIWGEGEGEGCGFVPFLRFHLQEQRLREVLFNSLGLQEQAFQCYDRNNCAA